jgi:hypothetical protein
MSVQRQGPGGEQLFDRLSGSHLVDPAVTQGTGFGSSPGLRVNGKIFAMLVRDELVVKLPKDRVDQLVASGAASRFDPGHGRIMMEWASVPTSGSRSWERLMVEAKQFVGTSPSSRPRSGRT